MKNENISQKTIKNEIHLSGVGLHSGKRCGVVIEGAKEDSGICFLDKDKNKINLSHLSVKDTRLSTVIGNEVFRVGTVEHLLAAVNACGLTNLTIHVTGPEVPALDGSARDFFYGFLDSGVLRQNKNAKLIKIKKQVLLTIGGKSAFVRPSEKLVIHNSINFNHPLIGTQNYTYENSIREFSEICESKTFGFLKDITALKKVGLALGGNLNNAIVLTDKGVVNRGHLKNNLGFVKHKTLDALGDFSLFGAQVLGEFNLNCSGHLIHSLLIKEVLSNKDNYEIRSSNLSV